MSSAESKDFVVRLRLLIGSRTQKEFAEWIGQSPQRVNNYLNTGTEPTADFLRSLAKKGVNVNWLLIGEGPVYVESGRETIPAEVEIIMKELGAYPQSYREKIVNLLLESFNFIKEEKVTPDEITKTLRLLAHIGRLQLERKKGQK